MATAEEWRRIIDTPYEVSSLGRVRRGSRILKPRAHTNGYARVSISIAGANTDRYIHRLVCAAFHGQPCDLMHADHINGNRADNRAENLRWLTPEANRALRTFQSGASHYASKLTEAQVREIRTTPFKRGQDGKFARSLGVARETIRDIRLGKIWRDASCKQQP